MDGARALAQENFSGAAIVRADTQTSGRGRIEGRKWIDAPGQSLLMTILLPADFKEVEALPLRAGLGVVRALERGRAASLRPAPESPGAEFLLKWPNDVLARLHFRTERAGKSAEPPDAGAVKYGKLCGILCESAGGRILIGIGMNLREVPQGQPHPDMPPASLEASWGALPPPFDNLDEAAHYMGQHVIDTLSDPWWHSEYERRLWGRGSTLQFLGGHPQSPEPVRGICAGVDGEGRLILDVGGERKIFASGEIASLRLV
jgi:BirA family biotin operon repressor/biotin-[acetyl-CoA-carboxylase] ligase